MRQADVPRIAGAALTAAIFLCLAPVFLNDGYSIENPKHWQYAARGEALIHGIPKSLPSRMPLSQILDAWFVDHGGRVAWQALPLVELTLVCLLGMLIGDRWLLAPSLAMLLLSTFDRAAAYRSWEGPYGIFPLLTAGILTWRADAPSFKKTILLSLSIGIAILYRSPMVFLPPVLALYELLFIYKRTVKLWWRHALILCVVPYLFILPWIRMNWLLEHRFVPLEREDTLWLGSAVGHVHLIWENPIYWNLRGVANSVPEWAVLQMLRDPYHTLGAIGQRLKYIIAFHPYLFLFAALGTLAGRKRPALRVLALMIAYLVAIQCCVPVDSRYLNPIWPLLCSLTVAGIVGFWAPWAALRTHGKALAGTSLVALTGFLIVPAVYALHRVNVYAGVMRRPGDKPRFLEEAIQRMPSDAWLFYERGMESLRRNDTAAASADLRRASVLRPADLRYRLQWATVQMLRGRHHSLRNWAQQSGGTFDLQAHLWRAYEYALSGQDGMIGQELCSAFGIYKRRLLIARQETNPSPTVEERQLYDLMDRCLYEKFIDEHRELWDFRPVKEKALIQGKFAMQKCL